MAQKHTPDNTATDSAFVTKREQIELAQKKVANLERQLEELGPDPDDPEEERRIRDALHEANEEFLNIMN